MPRRTSATSDGANVRLDVETSLRRAVRGRTHTRTERHSPGPHPPRRRRPPTQAAGQRDASVVVGLVLQDLVGAEELLEQDDPRELVGQRHRPEREPVVRALELEPERPAYGAGHGPPPPPAGLL